MVEVQLRLGGRGCKLPLGPMLLTVLYDPNTLLHHSVELIGHKLIDAHESSSRITRILDALHAHSSGGYAEASGITTPSFYNLINIQSSDDGEDRTGLGVDGHRHSPTTQTVQSIPATIHSERYIKHLSSIFTTFLQSGAVDEDGCILPECFPHRALLSTVVPNKQAKGKFSTLETSTEELKLPKDPFAHLGYYSFDLSAGMSKHTFTSILAAVNMALRGVEMILKDTKTAADPHIEEEKLKQGSQRFTKPIVFALTRPPGHHACHELSGGYCYINNAAVAAEYLLSKLPPPDSSRSSTQSRLVILDLDFHHGNGTQTIFFNRREPAYVSIHGEGEYPYYTGSINEEGNGEGKGFNLNLPLNSRPASNTEDYFRLLDRALDAIRINWIPEYLLVSMGFDTFRKDILGGFELDIKDYRTIGERIRALDLPVLILLEGGYSDELGELTISFLQGLASG